VCIWCAPSTDVHYAHDIHAQTPETVCGHLAQTCSSEAAITVKGIRGSLNIEEQLLVPVSTSLAL